MLPCSLNLLLSASLPVCVESALRVGPELRISSALLALSRYGYTLKVKHGHVVAIVATKEVDREREREREERETELSGLSGICRFRMSEFHVIFVEFA